MASNGVALREPSLLCAYFSCSLCIFGRLKGHLKAAVIQFCYPALPGPALLGWLLQQRAARHLTMDLLRAAEGLLRATAADPPLQREVRRCCGFLLVGCSCRTIALPVHRRLK